MSPRTGRPTDNPKPHRITVRMDIHTKAILDQYCDQKQVDAGEAVRRGVRKLEADLKK